MMHRTHMSRFYFKILLRLSVIKSFFAMGLDFDYNHSQSTIFGQSVAIVEGKKTTPKFHYLGYEIRAHIFQCKLAQSNKLSSHHLRLKRRYQKKFKINLELLDKWSFLLEALCENSMFLMKKEMFVIYLQSVFRNYFVHAMITKYEIISSKKLPLELQIIARDKTNIAFSYYDNQYCMLKKLLVGHLLNINTQIVTILY
jgi:hypothetical protein